MYTKKQHIARKTIITCLAFVGGMMSTVLAAAVYDANIQSRANTIFETIKNNARTMNPSERISYYQLVGLNIKSLMEVLVILDSKITTEQTIEVSIGEKNTYTGVVSSNTGNISPQLISVNVAAGTNIVCGDPARNDYTVYSDANSQVSRISKINKTYCNSKGGYVWNTCNGKFTEKRSVESIKEGDTFDCPVIPVKEPTAEQKERTRVSDLFAQKFENCSTEYKIATCTEFREIYSKTFESYPAKGENVGCNGNNKADTNGWNMNYFIEEIPNSNVVLRGWGCSVMHKGGYCRKGTTIEISVEDIKKELGTTDSIGSEDWGAGRNSWYTDKFTPAPLTDSCYTKVNEKMYHKEYFSQAFEPKIETVRTNDEKGQWMEWATQSVEKLSWTCKDSYGRTTQSNNNETLNREKYFSTWENLHKNNWPSGIYQCSWTLVGNGKTRYKDETITIK